VTSLSTAIGALGTPLGPNSESDLVIDLNSGSIPIAIMDEYDHRISFNSLKKSVTSLSTAIGALGSPLGPRPESDVATDLYSGSTPIAIKTSPITRSVLDNFKKVTTSLQEVTKAYGSPPESPPKIDLATKLYSSSALAADYDKMGPSNSNDLFRSLNT
jgi:hypothetical protein